MPKETKEPTKEPTVESLLVEVAALRGQLAERDKATEAVGKREILIKEKIGAGLTRSQAEQVVKDQEAWDAQQAEEAAAAAKKAK